MEGMLNYSLKVLRERDFSRLEEDVQQAILSLFVDDRSKPSKQGRQTLAMHSGMLGVSLDIENYCTLRLFLNHFHYIESFPGAAWKADSHSKPSLVTNHITNVSIPNSTLACGAFLLRY